MKNILTIAMVAIAILSCQPKKTEQNTNEETTTVFKPFVEKIDDRLNQLIDDNAKIEVLAGGFIWTEGPLWIDDMGLIFSDIPQNKIYLWTEKDSISEYLSPSGYTGIVDRTGEPGSNGLILDNEGNLVLCQHGDRRVALMNASLSDPKPEFETLVDSYLGKKLNSPNDACFDGDGALYFTDPPYGLEGNMEDPSKELDFQGVYRYADGKLDLLTDEMSRPNGIVILPGSSSLLVANSDPNKAVWMKFDLNDEKEVVASNTFYDATEFAGNEKGLPDGLKVDPKGNIFATGPGGVWIFSPEGEVLGKIKTGQATSNCAFGNNGRYLYMTADDYLMRVPLKN